VANPKKSQSSARRFESVPLLDLHRQYKAIRPEVLTAIERVCSSQHFILGPEVEALEREIAAFTGTTEAVGCASGTDALWLALVAAGIGPGDGVITTSFSFFASSSAIVRAGARPVLVDIEPDTLNLDPALVTNALRSPQSSNVKAILPVHLYGQCVDMDRFGDISEEFRVPILEDAAQAIGAKWKNRLAGSLGTVAAFSFYPTKNLSAYGEAGIVTTSDSKMAEHMRRLRSHGSPRRYLHEEFGWNARMDAIQAAVLRVKLKHIDTWNEKRRHHAAKYDGLFEASGLVSHGEPIQLPTRTSGAYHVFHQYVVRAQRRDELRKFLSDRQIGTEVYYPIPLHLQPCFGYLGYKLGDLPECERAAKDVMALPMFPELTSAEQEWVVESIAEFYS
jgi:dTDP-4-amino-4,6-dideoxygalactose transaminase